MKHVSIGEILSVDSYGVVCVMDGLEYWHPALMKNGQVFYCINYHYVCPLQALAESATIFSEIQKANEFLARLG